MADLFRARAHVPAWLLVLGFVGALAYWLENAWQSWSAVHLERTLDASPALAALGPAVFAGSMAAGRLLVHRLARPGAERAVLVGGASVAALWVRAGRLRALRPARVGRARRRRGWVLGLRPDPRQRGRAGRA